MATLRTLAPIGCNDAWGFSGRGRWRYVHTSLERRRGSVELHLEADGPPREGAPVGPGEPRG